MGKNERVTLTLILVLVAALLMGVLIGCVGIGGVLLPPALVYLGGLGFHAAAATSTWAFLFCAAAGTWSYSGRGSIDWRMAAWLGAGVVPAAFAGARANAALPEGLLMAILAALMVLTGSDALLRGSPGSVGGTRRLGIPALLAIGAFVGFGSALTGTGGAVLLVPILLLLRVPVLAAVGAAQAVALATLWAVRRLLDVIEVGDVEAQSLGLNVTRLRLVVVIAASLATAAAVAVAGLIGFVGLIIPHTVRLMVGGSYRSVLPLSVLFGASFLIFVDTLARTVVAPAEIPIGVITAFIGAPFFIAVLRRNRRAA